MKHKQPLHHLMPGIAFALAHEQQVIRDTNWKPDNCDPLGKDDKTKKILQVQKK